jgi:hypothetical protein
MNHFIRFCLVLGTITLLPSIALGICEPPVSESPEALALPVDALEADDALSPSQQNGARHRELQEQARWRR